MSQFLTNFKHAFMRTVVKDSFNRDVLILLIVSIFIGSLLASGISLAAKTYLSKTVSNLAGDYGENDLLIQVREDVKEDAVAQIQQVINDVFPGAKLTVGPTLTGKAYIMISLPDQYKNKENYEAIGSIFGSIPGGGSVGVMSEPRLTIRSVPPGAIDMLMQRISQIDGVRFPFRDGNSIGILVTSIEKVSAVNEQVKNLLNQYQIIEISFPVGSQPENPIRLGEAIANGMKNDLKLEFAANVSIDTKNDDMTYLVATMIELKRFLAAYASKVTITPGGGERLKKGDVIVFQGAAATPLTVGAAVERSNVLVEVTGVRPDEVAEGLITQGDTSQLTNLQGNKIVDNVASQVIGTITFYNPRQELSVALTETTKLVGQIPGISQDAQKMSSMALSALDNYSNSVTAVEQTLNNLQAAGTTIDAVTSGLARLETGPLQLQLANSSRVISNVMNTLQLVKLVSGDAAATLDSLTTTQRNLTNLKDSLATIDNVATTGRQVKTAVNTIIANGNSTLATLQAFDVDGAKSSLSSANNRLAQLQQLNIPLVTAQLQYLAASVPDLRDEEISQSIKLIDKVIAGQVIPSARIQILTTKNISTTAVAPTVYREAGQNNVSLYSTTLGVIESDPRGEVMQILSEVRAILAGMTCIIMTLLLLVLDHTAVITFIRRKRLAIRVGPTGWRKVAAQFGGIFTTPERQYGMTVGAVMLTTMFVISKGGIPYLPWLAVPVLGAFLGLFVASYAERISPISVEEVMAGEALGLSFDEIMREIVVPSGRPGLMQKLNQRKVKFK